MCGSGRRRPWPRVMGTQSDVSSSPGTQRSGAWRSPGSQCQILKSQAWAGPGGHARQALLLLRLELEGRTEHRTWAQGITLWGGETKTITCFLWVIKAQEAVLSVMCGAGSGTEPTRRGCRGQISDTAPPGIPWPPSYEESPHLPRTLKAWRAHLAMKR